MIEAGCRGRAVVGSRVGGIPDVVADGETGLLVPPGDALALAEALERVLSDRALAERLGAEARIRVEPWLATPEEYARRVRDLVDKVVSAGVGAQAGRSPASEPALVGRDPLRLERGFDPSADLLLERGGSCGQAVEVRVLGGSRR